MVPSVQVYSLIYTVVMVGLVPTIHVFFCLDRKKSWMVATSATMTME
jgi:hypothetical protein